MKKQAIAAIVLKENRLLRKTRKRLAYTCKMFFWKRHANAGLQLSPLVRHDWRRMKVSAGLILMFVLGGITGALGFKHIGFICVVPLAALLLVLSVPPFMRDAAQSAERPSLFSKKS